MNHYLFLTDMLQCILWTCDLTRRTQATATHYDFWGSNKKLFGTISLAFQSSFDEDRSYILSPNRGEIALWLESEFTDRNFRRSNPTSSSRLPLYRLGQPGIIRALGLPPGGIAATHQKGVTTGRVIFLILLV
ncbi:hypothetical protein CSKR_106830 [Clonorchis sinensis]|uniref:Uncharacterized protein n=1 Tax=Clonorchis sinensis TaxID=79923 RepID=A0A3R7CZP4_CLOSI|nr:hypothetical protein CSKR_106830 [Clonorchis sinensis]